MKRYRTRKKVSAHNRGEHRGQNLVFARAGCTSCQADVEDVRRRTAEHIEEGVRVMFAGQAPEVVEKVIERTRAMARTEGFL